MKEIHSAFESGASNQMGVWGCTLEGYNASLPLSCWREFSGNQCLWCNFLKKCISAVLERNSDITLRVRLLTGFPSAWLPNVTGALRIPISSPPQLEILENNPLPTLAPPSPPPPSPFSDRTGQSWTKTFHQQGSCIHPGPDWSGAPRYVTGFWSILACLQKEFTCRRVCWKCGKVADELMDFSPLEQSEAKNPNNIRLQRPHSPVLLRPVQLSKSSRQYFTTLTSINFYYRPNLDTNRVNITLSKQNKSDPEVQVCVVSLLHKH